MWDAATIKIVLGGLANARDLDDLSRIAGQRDESTTTWSTDPRTGRSSTISSRSVPILPVDVIRNLPFGTGIVLHRATRPAMTTLTPWWRRPDRRRLHADVHELEERSGAVD